MKAFDIKNIKKVFEIFYNKFLTRAYRLKEHLTSSYQSSYLTYTDEFQNKIHSHIISQQYTQVAVDVKRMMTNTHTRTYTHSCPPLILRVHRHTRTHTSVARLLQHFQECFHYTHTHTHTHKHTQVAVSWRFD